MQLSMDAQYYWEALRPYFAERRFILAMGPLTHHTAWVQHLMDLGAEPPLILAHGHGAGPLPNPLECAWHLLPCRGNTVAKRMHDYDTQLTALPTEALTQIDRFDPHGEAQVLCSFVSPLTTVASRPRFGASPSHWWALDNKTIIDDFWDSCGIDRTASLTVSSQSPDLWEQSQRFDLGAGIVWSGDSEALNGGADFVRHIHSQDDAAAAQEFFRQHSTRVRIMPYLEGIPCSIHGMVCPDGIAAFRPCEMFVVRNAATQAFQYLGAGTNWDPHPDDREAMRTIARIVGARLRDTMGYRGAYTVDGIMTAAGFRPTELNPRFGAGMMRLEDCCDRLPLELLDIALKAEVPIDYRCAELEALALKQCDAQRSTVIWGFIPQAQLVEAQRYDIHHAGTQLRVADATHGANASLALAPMGSGAALRFQPVATELRRGRPLGPLTAQLLSLAQELLGLPPAQWCAAREVR